MLSLAFPHPSTDTSQPGHPCWPAWEQGGVCHLPQWYCAGPESSRSLLHMFTASLFHYPHQLCVPG